MSLEKDKIFFGVTNGKYNFSVKNNNNYHVMDPTFADSIDGLALKLEEYHLESTKGGRNLPWTLHECSENLPGDIRSRLTRVVKIHNHYVEAAKDLKQEFEDCNAGETS